MKWKGKKKKRMKREKKMLRNDDMQWRQHHEMINYYFPKMNKSSLTDD